MLLQLLTAQVVHAPDLPQKAHLEVLLICLAMASTGNPSRWAPNGREKSCTMASWLA